MSEQYILSSSNILKGAQLWFFNKANQIWNIWSSPQKRSSTKWVWKVHFIDVTLCLRTYLFLFFCLTRVVKKIILFYFIVEPLKFFWPDQSYKLHFDIWLFKCVFFLFCTAFFSRLHTCAVELYNFTFTQP